MKTTLYSNIIRRSVQVPNSRKRAKIVELIAKKVEHKTEHWHVGEMMVETGFIDKEGLFFPIEYLSDVREDGELKLDYSKGRNTPDGDIFLSQLIRSRVLDKEKELIGRAYDFEIYVAKKPWMVWKILVEPKGLNPHKKRMRINTKYVEDILPNKIILNDSFNLKGEDD
ncbi:MAG: hypothetical protein R6U61_08390 [Thermoplasmata archaeon]